MLTLSEHKSTYYDAITCGRIAFNKPTPNLQQQQKKLFSINNLPNTWQPTKVGVYVGPIEKLNN